MSNLGGPFGIKQFCAIINPPQSGILAVGSGMQTYIIHDMRVSFVCFLIAVL